MGVYGGRADLGTSVSVEVTSDNIACRLSVADCLLEGIYLAYRTCPRLLSRERRTNSKQLKGDVLVFSRTEENGLWTTKYDGCPRQRKSAYSMWVCRHYANLALLAVCLTFSSREIRFKLRVRAVLDRQYSIFILFLTCSSTIYSVWRESKLAGLYAEWWWYRYV